MPLSKEERAQLEQLLEKDKEPLERSEKVHVDFIYDPDDASSVKKGLQRGHLTIEDAESWGYSKKDLGIKDEEGGDGGGGSGDDGDGMKPKRKGYFTEE